MPKPSEAGELILCAFDLLLTQGKFFVNETWAAVFAFCSDLAGLTVMASGSHNVAQANLTMIHFLNECMGTSTF
jgi:hypothetical protein